MRPNRNNEVLSGLIGLLAVVVVVVSIVGGTILKKQAFERVLGRQISWVDYFLSR